MITLLNLEKFYGPLPVIRGVSLDISKGEAVCLVGPSGSGKSTLLRCVNNLETLSAGEIRLDGERVYYDPSHKGLKPHSQARIAAVRARLGMVFQDFNLFPHMTALQNVMEGPVQVLGVRKDEARHRALDLLKRVGLAERHGHFPDELSGGQKQRVAIARALAMKPEAMLFDEPTSALDPELVHEVLSVMRELRNDGMTMIIATHEMNFAREVADRIVFLDDGLIVEDSAPSQFFDVSTNPRKASFLRSLTRR
ncbi:MULTISPECIES: amino acid ABC transporter ATP-binding protein [unclassified Mesorhizobium]|uniref:amino acid ABC transporter ATP-binding protein n=1 Tax=unclassified Mesorhizobium TaxID=325217 RepID=UPI000FCA61E1|nr:MULTISPECIES: amino acid ABC transporter ATP-binding protein [unclassified Mesorhizobium]TGP21455.1 amino acid ABC transporter ATP-binding protein [Mesorhizobium sp. M1D.F.Ca.ET.231.01.1.1]TGP28902.1 amino acid ABC transporter ATP-binding protein [Mesorhizobium sp. M1D.F.Ca.ET.234.01.1.1]TGS43370.1 amino acid ABC transporter ATP-binding protein [Mesorhizobium sp. M1D.F.Ca.ET.184.01.1.1]TGS59918.1 amino acid ABC transporter ATP-binding protein [Mesorhizobium sp. M1D.F.Ca.ET.183.01.1.1]